MDRHTVAAASPSRRHAFHDRSPFSSAAVQPTWNMTQKLHDGRSGGAWSRRWNGAHSFLFASSLGQLLDLMVTLGMHLTVGLLWITGHVCHACGVLTSSLALCVDSKWAFVLGYTAQMAGLCQLIHNVVLLAPQNRSHLLAVVQLLTIIRLAALVLFGLSRCRLNRATESADESVEEGQTSPPPSSSPSSSPSSPSSSSTGNPEREATVKIEIPPPSYDQIYCADRADGEAAPPPAYETLHSDAPT